MSTKAPDQTLAATRLSYRVLPPEEWPKLLAIEPFKSRGLPDADADSWAVLVVERVAADGTVQVVGTCSLFTAMHWDCWWLDPLEPGASRGVILRQLLREALSLLAEVGAEEVYTGVEDRAPDGGPGSAPGVTGLLERFGFTPATGRLFVLDIPTVQATMGAALGQEE